MKKTVLAVTALLISLLLAACGGVGGELMAVAPLGNGRQAEAYGGITGVRTVIIRAADGSEEQRFTCKNKTTEPYAEGDGENYGFAVGDVDFDGISDLIVTTSRSTEGNICDYFRADGNGGFYRDSVLSVLRGVRFDREAGEAYVTTRTHTELPTVPNAPSRYTDEIKVTYYAPNAEKNGRFEVVREETLTYYSETEIYCFAVYYPDDNGEMQIEDEKWILPDKLARAGLENFGD